MLKYPFPFTETHIRGDRFISSATLVIDDRAHLETLRQARELPRGVVFCKTDYLPFLFDAIRDQTDKVLLLITALSSLPITRKLYERKPPCIKTWFARNITMDPIPDDMRPLPLGLQPYAQGPAYAPWVFETLLENPPEKDIGVYLNFSKRTNYSERDTCWRTWYPRNDVMASAYAAPYGEYIWHVARSRFVLSPAGSGEECHRTYEALYLGAIPIVKRTPLSIRLYRDLPVLYVNSWDEDDIGSLDFCYEATDTINNTKPFCWERLTMRYWYEEINRERRALGV